MTALELVAAAAATWQAIEIYRHSQQPTVRSCRARLEILGGDLGHLFDCSWCLSVWVGFGLCGWRWAIEVSASAAELHWSLAAVRTVAYGAWFVLVYGLAVSRLANAANDLTHRFNRTPKGGLLGTGRTGGEPAGGDPGRS